MRTFIFIVYNVTGHQVYDSVADHFGVDTKVFMVVKAFQHRVGYGSNPHLQSGAVVYEFRNIFTDQKFFLAHFCAIIDREQLFLMPHHFMNFGVMNHTVPMSPWHSWIHLCNDCGGTINRGSCYIYRRSKCTVPMLVGR